MKRIFVFIVFIVFLAGCASNQNISQSHTQTPVESPRQSQSTPPLNVYNSSAVPSNSENSQSPQPTTSEKPVSSQNPEEFQTSSPTITERNDESPEPIIYEIDGQVYLACGIKTVCLGKLTLIETDGEYGNNLNGMLTSDNKIVYYLSNVNDKTGAGDLMRIDIGDSLTPVLITEDVCTAVASEDGERVLYLKNEANGLGDLFLQIGSNSEKISDNIIIGDPEFTGGGYGFSKNGKNIYFIKQNGTGDNLSYSLYTKDEGQQLNLVTETKPASGDTFSRLLIANDGDMVYSMWTNKKSILNYYTNGNNEVMSSNSGDVFIQATFGDVNDFLYLEDNSLYYKSPGKDPIELSDAFDTVRFDKPYWITDADKKGFILAEKSENETHVKLYEVTTDMNKIYLSEADSYSDFTNNDVTCVTFTLDGELFVMQKTDNVWGDKQLVCGEGTPWEDFDPAGKYLYFFDNAYYINTDSWDAGWCGDLCRYRLSDGKRELLLKNATSCNLFDNVILGFTNKGAAYRIIGPDQKEKISEKASKIWGNSSGMYVMTTKGDTYSISFLTKDGINSGVVCSNAQQILLFNGYIE